MYRYLEQRVLDRVLEFLRKRHPEAALPAVVIEQPPSVALGDFAIPIFPFAKPLRSAPLKIAESIRSEIGPIEGIAEFKVAPPGYLNVRIDRAWLAQWLAADRMPRAVAASGKVLVEHTSINPNKAAHIGHLRNAVLGDTFVRLLRNAGREVDVQNYIDNTGVQVADVIVGFTHLAKKSKAEIEALTREPRFDYYCWDLYARVSQWYEQDKGNLQARSQALHALERGNNETAAVGEIIASAVLRRHLETMDRLEIEYDFLPRESEILRLHFWDAAFTKLKDAGVLTFENEGKNKGCWVMRRAETGKFKGEPVQPAAGDEDDADRISEEDQKVIVRSNGTVGYVGKDIAYHMWKFGLLNRDFSYRRFYRYPDAHECWISTTPDDPEASKHHPHFGGVTENYNVIDARQAEAQNTVMEALRDLGHGEAAVRLTHLSYGMVVLTPNCAAELGYQLTEEEKSRSFIGVSGRKGFGVKADDLIDQLIASAKGEVDSRHPQLTDAERQSVATKIAVGALRYFMLKYTKQSVIAFDFKEALSFEGETGPYAQYAVVRANGIFNKAGIAADDFAKQIAARIPTDVLSDFLNGEKADEIWELWLASAKTSYIVNQCIATTEPAYLAKHAFQLAQLFNAFYHRYPILSEPDEKRKQFLLATVAVVRRELIRTLAVMGITVPPVM